jgi:hypothetical protein
MDPIINNPFPLQATSSEEGVIITETTRFTVLKTPEIDRVESAAAPYFILRQPDASRAGRSIYLYGPPGSGKTHAIQYLRRQYAPQRIEGRVLSQLDIYVKCKSTDFLVLFRDLMAQITLPAMKELSRNFTAQVAREKFVAKIERMQGREASQAAAPTEIDYDTAQSLFDRFLLERNNIENAQEQEIVKSAVGRSELKHVLPYITDVNLDARARNWLIGNQDMLRSDLERLGVIAPIENQELAQATLFAFIRILGRVSIPGCLYIDQLEKFLLDMEGRPIPTNIGLMHSLVEFTQREGALLVLASTDAVWKALPIEFKQRFGTAQIGLPPLKLQTARSLILAYFNSARSPERDDISPFNESSVEKLLLTSAGNIRRFLQHCAVVMDYALQHHLKTLSVNDLDDALNRSDVGTPIRDKVLEAIARIAAAKGVALRPNSKFQNWTVDFLVVGPSQRVRGIVQVCEAFFRDAVTDVAWNVMALAREARLGATPAPTILVVVGYADPDIVKTLSSVVNQVIVFSPESFATEFGSVLGALPPEPLPALQAEERSRIETTIQEGEKQVRSAQQERQAQVSRANDAAAAVLVEESRQSDRERWRTMRVEWLREKKAIEQEIDKRRTERIQTDLNAIQAATVKVQKRRERQAQLLVGGCLLGSFVVISPLYLRFFGLGGYGIYPREGTLLSQLLALGIAIGIALTIIFMGAKFSPIFFSSLYGSRQLREPTNSFEELDDLAGSYAKRFRNKSYYDHSNPQIRYARVLAIEGFSIKTAEKLVELLKFESLRLIRWRAAEKLGSMMGSMLHDNDPERELRDLFVQCLSLLDAPYIVESMARTSETPPIKLMRRMSLKPKIIAALSNIELLEYRELPTYLAFSWKRGDHTDDPMLQAFEGGFNDANWKQLYQNVRPLTIQSVLDELSPLTNPGLGTYDRLNCIGDISQLYIFFRQWQYLLESDFVP